MSYKEYTVRVWNDGCKEWYLNGKLHREEDHSGTKRWYLNGNLHREDGPAIELANGSKYWHLNGHLHREDGPAVEWANGTKLWYLNDQEYTEEEFKRKAQKLKELTVAELENLLGYPVKIVKE